MRYIGKSWQYFGRHPDLLGLCVLGRLVGSAGSDRQRVYLMGEIVLTNNGRILAASVALVVAGGGAVVAASGQAEEGPGVEVQAAQQGVALIAPGVHRDELSAAVEKGLQAAAANGPSSPILSAAASSGSRVAVRVVASSIGDVSVVGVEEGVCLISDDFGISCGPGPARTTMMGGAALRGEGESSVLFLVSDKVSAVRVRVPGGGEIRLPVKDNVAAGVVGGEPEAYDFLDASGVRLTGVNPGPDERVTDRGEVAGV